MSFYLLLPLAALYTFFFVLPLIPISLIFIGFAKISKIQTAILKRQKVIKLIGIVTPVAATIYIAFT